MLRATFKSLLSRKARLLLSSIAVMLGVMFIVGTLVLNASLGRSFEQLFSDTYESIDVQVLDSEAPSEMEGEPFDSEVVEDVEAVSGAERVDGLAVGQVSVIDQEGKIVPSFTSFTIGQNWIDPQDPIEMREGTEPTADDEIIVSAGLVNAVGYDIGDEVPLVTAASPNEEKFEIVGVFGYSGGRDTVSGESTIGFTEDAAQRFLVGNEDGVKYHVVYVEAAEGVDPDQLRDDIAAALGNDFKVQTGEEVAEEGGEMFQQVLDIFSYILWGFGGVALLVSIFLIINTFSIIVAQRTKELALFRAMGAARGQVTRSVMLEALVVGVLSGLVGLGLGVAVGYAGTVALGTSFVDMDTALVVPWTAYVTAFVIGVGVTMVAAVFPALRAGRISPMAALREASAVDRPVKAFGFVGGTLLAGGGGLLAASLAGAFGEAADSSTMWAGFGGVMLLFAGAAVFVPVVARPAVAVIGRLMSWSLPGKLGRRNSARNPRRTAITATTLMIGVTLVTAVGVLSASMQASMTKYFEENITADLLIQGEQTGPEPPTFSPNVLDDAADVDNVEKSTGMWVEMNTQVDGERQYVMATDDLPVLVDLMGMTEDSGDLDVIAEDELVLSTGAAENNDLDVGDTVTMDFATDSQEMTVSAIADFGGMDGGWLISADNSDKFAQTNPTQAYVQVSEGADVSDVSDDLAALLTDNPMVTVSDISVLTDQVEQIFDIFLLVVQILLGLAMLIAVIGVVNTLTLSVLERTRELGLLRATGLTRGQVTRMVTVESVVIALFGALLGLGLGAGLGIAVRELLADDFLTELALPWGTMFAYVVAALVVGLLAALIPAYRANRLDLLKAISYE